MHAVQTSEIEPKVEFENKSFETTSYIGMLCIPIITTFTVPIFIPLSYHETLELTNDEVIIHGKNICFGCIPGTYESRKPYGELGDVSIGNDCCCLWKVYGGMGIFVPGWGCNKDLVKEIHSELKNRSMKRGDQAQLKKSEQTIEILTNLTKEITTIRQDIDLIMDHLKISRSLSINR